MHGLERLASHRWSDAHRSSEVGEAEPHNLGNPDTEKRMHTRPYRSLNMLG